jgi:ABC-type antimicrobial peptide transport system permease subunit
VGVIPDIRSNDMFGTTAPAIYVALSESPASSVTLLVGTSGADAIIPMVRQAVTEVDATVPMRSFFWMDDVVTAAYSTTWVMMGLLVVLAVLSTGLGAIGIYAVLAYHVALSKREIGVRMALGAQTGTLVLGIVRSGLVLAGVGILLGSLAAVYSTRFLESVLFGVSALSPIAFVAPAVALFLAAGVAALVPAARAGSLPPAQVLRNE